MTYVIFHVEGQQDMIRRISVDMKGVSYHVLFAFAIGVPLQ